MLATVDDLGLELRDVNCWLRVIVRRQPFPNAQSDWDRDAFDAVVEVDTGIFRGGFGTTLWAHELANLRALLQALLDRLGQHRKASFALMEHGADSTSSCFAVALRVFKSPCEPTVPVSSASTSSWRSMRHSSLLASAKSTRYSRAFRQA
jgi:hypothetical protein